MGLEQTEPRDSRVNGRTHSSARVQVKFVSFTHSEYSKRQVNVQDAVILQNDGLLLIKCLADDVAFLAGNDNLSDAGDEGQTSAH